jgi:hypothetical protein
MYVAKIHFDANNGGVHLKRVVGDVSSCIVNGGIQVELASAVWDGRHMVSMAASDWATIADHLTPSLSL